MSIESLGAHWRVWKMMSIGKGYAKMLLGYFGKTPCEPDSEVVKIAHEQLGLEPTTETVVDLNDKDPNKGLEVAKKRLEEAGLEVNKNSVKAFKKSL